MGILDRNHAEQWPCATDSRHSAIRDRTELVEQYDRRTRHRHHTRDDLLDFVGTGRRTTKGPSTDVKKGPLSRAYGRAWLPSSSRHLPQIQANPRRDVRKVCTVLVSRKY